MFWRYDKKKCRFHQMLYIYAFIVLLIIYHVNKAISCIKLKCVKCRVLHIVLTIPLNFSHYNCTTILINLCARDNLWKKPTAHTHKVGESEWMNCVAMRENILYQTLINISIDRQNAWNLHKNIIITLIVFPFRCGTMEDTHSEAKKNAVNRRIKSAMRSQSDIANNEKYCSFAQTLESDEPIKLVAQIKTNYNVSVQDDEIGPGNLLSRNRQKRIYFRAIHVAGDLSHRNYRQMRCNAKKSPNTVTIADKPSDSRACTNNKR